MSQAVQFVQIAQSVLTFTNQKKKILKCDDQSYKMVKI